MKRSASEIMPSGKFHKKPFDEGTLTKLSLFELYTREWLPVFLGQPTPTIKQKIARPDVYYHVHRKVWEYYQELLPDPTHFYLARFSIKKGSNIYGLIFGSRAALGMDKFLHVAWTQDPINGEADYDIGRENMVADQ